ncbi:MAG: tetratricopeptide repeat protein [Dysgonamonadaceae bacterium]|jgi:tetratricopeptide (TPR) repeat protein|nr:tetratricopeptide repeat protein [Dysgonamonadaceae bacterium]
MDTRQKIDSQYNQIIAVLEDKKLKKVFELIALFLSQLQNWQSQEKLNSLEDTYKIMLKYFQEGIQDSEREKVYNNIIYSLYQITDLAYLQLKTSNDNSLFYEKRRHYHYYVPETTEQLFQSLEDVYGKIALLSVLEDEERNNHLKDLEQQKEEFARKIFYSVWLSDAWTDSEKENWSNLIKNQPDTTYLPCLIISGITLNLLECFDEKKAIVLFEAAMNKQEEVRVRALTGIVLFLRKYNNRLFLYPSILSLLEQLKEDSKFIYQIRHVLLQFILSKETEKITRKINDELLPEMMKMNPKLGNQIKMDDFISESGIDERNPEWQKIIEDTGLQDKLQELSELQLEGADIMHSSFTHLKNYPFFDELSHWFTPFTIPSDAFENQELTQFAKVLMNSKMLCDSDKYSFYLSILQMPENYRKMMTSQFSAENEAMQNMQKEELTNPTRKIDHHTRQYIQDLYRFYKLHPKRADFEDIFEAKPELYKIPSINRIIKDKDSLFIIGEYYFNKNYFMEASDIFGILPKTETNNDVLYQKRGYCLQMMGDIKQALENYQKAELLNANNSWTIKKLAYCYRILKKPEEALHYYNKAQQLNPDNMAIQLNIGHCYLNLKEYDQALKYYFKVEYLAKNKEKAWRAISWCSFLIGKHEQAMNYSNQILAKNPNSTDYLNAGHIQLASGNMKEAIRLYRASREISNDSHEEFVNIFSNDIPELIQAGRIKEKDIPFIIDSLMYES